MNQVEIKGLFAEYSPLLPILKDVSFKIEAGEIISIIGIKSASWASESIERPCDCK